MESALDMIVPGMLVYAFIEPDSDPVIAFVLSHDPDTNLFKVATDVTPESYTDMDRWNVFACRMTADAMPNDLPIAMGKYYKGFVYTDTPVFLCARLQRDFIQTGDSEVPFNTHSGRQLMAYYSENYV